MVANMFLDLKYPERTERWFGIGVVWDGAIQCGCGGLPGEKLTDGIYTRRSAGYKVVATSEPICNCGSVALFYRDPPTFEVEAIH